MLRSWQEVREEVRKLSGQHRKAQGLPERVRRLEAEVFRLRGHTKVVEKKLDESNQREREGSA